MSQSCCLYTASKESYGNFIAHLPPMRLQSNISPDDILCLQEMFLTRGLHHIAVSDILTGRTLIRNFLQSMHYFHSVACLTQTYQSSLENDETNLLKCVADYCGTSATLDVVEEYFLECYCADFLWVELSKTLLSNPVVLQIAHIMHKLNIAHTMPVMAISLVS